MLPDFYDDLAATLREAWRMLETGTRDRRSAFHTPTLATIGRDGAPRLRTVVLRSVASEQALLRFHTDRRSAKVEELERDAAVQMHVYDPAAKLQLRLTGGASLHCDDTVASEAWAATAGPSRACYASEPGPGVDIDCGGAYVARFDSDRPDAGRANFCAVVVRLQTLEWLYLAHKGHRRARFDLPSGNGRWLVP